MHHVGSGFKIINYPTFENKDSDNPEEWYLQITPEAEIIVNEKIDEIKKYRGQIISNCVDIDNLLGRAISSFFLRSDPEKREIFHELILDTTLFSFAQKKKILQLIHEKFPENSGLSKEMRKEFFDKFNYIIKMRNAMAHGEITIDFGDDKVILQYYDSNRNEKTEVHVSPEFFKDISRKISDLVFNLWSSDNFGVCSD